MDNHYVDKFQYSYSTNSDNYELPFLLKTSLKLISNFFQEKNNHKLCLIFPSKEFVAQWLSIPLALKQIQDDFITNHQDIYNAYQKFKPGDKLIINNAAIVEWVGHNDQGIKFKTREERNASAAIHIIEYKNVEKLQPAPPSRSILSLAHKARIALYKEITDPLDKFLGINSFGNRSYQKNSITLISKIHTFDYSLENILLNTIPIKDYIFANKIDDYGNTENRSPLLLSNNFRNLSLYLSQADVITKLIIDGYSAINERGTDFNDIDVLKIPTVLISDLSEIEHFENIYSYNFDIFNFTKENIELVKSTKGSPFFVFEEKLIKYVSFDFKKEVLKHRILEKVENYIISIERDDSNDNLNVILMLLVQIINSISRLAHIPLNEELSVLKDKINRVESNYISNKYWLGQSTEIIGFTIKELKFLVDIFAKKPSPKCLKLKELLNKKKYDFIICSRSDEVKYLTEYLRNANISKIPDIISIADLTDLIITNKPVKAILTGWPKSIQYNHIISSFCFNELVVLFYNYETKYFNYFQKKNQRLISYIKPTINENGIKSENITETEFIKLYNYEEDMPESFDIAEFELRLDNIQYSKFSAKGNLTESCKARRIDFENNKFIFTTDSHKFIIINELLDPLKTNPNIYSKKFEYLRIGHVIAFIDTDRDILAQYVERNTNTLELKSIQQWTNLWKELLREYYNSVGNDFKKVVKDLRNYECTKHEATIRNWIQDDILIGPDSDNDLLSIAALTSSDILYNNISKVRESINKMINLRFQASTFIRDKIKNKLLEIANPSIMNESIDIIHLGSVDILKIFELNKDLRDIDKKYVHRLLKKEII